MLKELYGWNHETAARTILTKADSADVSVPREPPITPPRSEMDEESIPDDRTILVAEGSQRPNRR